MNKPIKGSRWNKQEMDYLKRNYKKKSIKQIASYLGREFGSVMTYAGKMGLTPGRLPMDIKKDNETMARWNKDVEDDNS